MSYLGLNQVNYCCSVLNIWWITAASMGLDLDSLTLSHSVVSAHRFRVLNQIKYFKAKDCHWVLWFFFGGGGRLRQPCSVTKLDDTPGQGLFLYAYAKFAEYVLSRNKQIWKVIDKKIRWEICKQIGKICSLCNETCKQIWKRTCRKIWENQYAEYAKQYAKYVISREYDIC
jgi:hypothetical protein